MHLFLRFLRSIGVFVCVQYRPIFFFFNTYLIGLSFCIIRSLVVCEIHLLMFYSKRLCVNLAICYYYYFCSVCRSVVWHSKMALQRNSMNWFNIWNSFVLVTLRCLSAIDCLKEKFVVVFLFCSYCCIKLNWYESLI